MRLLLLAFVATVQALKSKQQDDAGDAGDKRKLVFISLENRSGRRELIRAACRAAAVFCGEDGHSYHAHAAAIYLWRL